MFRRVTVSYVFLKLNSSQAIYFDNGYFYKADVRAIVFRRQGVLKVIKDIEQVENWEQFWHVSFGILNTCISITIVM